ncbi:tetratricopeptide repeat protein [Spirosoma migulaei]
METQQGVGNKGISTFLSFGAKNVQPDILEKMLVGRQKTVNLLEQYAREIALNGVNHQVFIVGPRGAGKTHMLRVLYYRIHDLVEKKAIVVSYFAEEEYGISGYLDFLIRIINAFMRWYDSDKPALEAQLNILRETPESRQEYVAENIISDFVEDKPLLILSENFDTILEALGKDGQSKLRAWLYRHNRISIIATAQATSPDLGREDRPFYGFFYTITLKKLTYEESLELLRNLAKIEKNPKMIEHLAGKGQAQVRAIHELIKGNHRLLVTFYEFLKADTLAELSKIFMKTMNDLKPYYETFIRFLPTQQQKILYYLALANIPQKGTDIAKNCFIATTSLTKQLSELQRQHLVDALPDPTDRRNKLYDVSEPLLRIAIQIGEHREGVAALFIDFLARCYSHEEIKNQKFHFENLYLTEVEPLKKQKLYLEVEARDRAMKLQVELGIVQKTLPIKALEQIKLGNVYRKQGNYDQAVEAYKIAIQIEANNEIIWTNLGAIYCDDQGNYPLAIEAFQRAIQLKPDYEMAWYNLGVTYSKQDNYLEAINAYKKAAQLNSGDESTWYNLGSLYSRYGDYIQSINSYMKVIQLKPNDALVWSNIGEAYKKLGNYDQAIEAYHKAIHLEPTDKSNWINLGVIYSNGKDNNLQAIEAFQKAIQLKPDDATAWDNIGIAYGKHGNYIQSSKALHKAIELRPHHAETWYNLGVLYTRTNDYLEAINSFKKAIQLNIRDERVWGNLGIAYAKQGDHLQAIEAFQKSIQLNPSSEKAWYNIGINYNQQGNQIKAIKAYQKAIELNPNASMAINKLEKVIISYLQPQTIESELANLETWLQNHTGFEITTKYVNVYRRLNFNNDEKALYELPKEQRIFFEREILKRPTE